MCSALILSLFFSRVGLASDIAVVAVVVVVAFALKTMCVIKNLSISLFGMLIRILHSIDVRNSCIVILREVPVKLLYFIANILLHYSSIHKHIIMPRQVRIIALQS